MVNAKNEVMFWFLIILMAPAVLIHFMPYLAAFWQPRMTTLCGGRQEKANNDNALHTSTSSQGCVRVHAFFGFALVMGPLMFAIICYGYPPSKMLFGGEYCKTRTVNNNCRMPEQQSTHPILYHVFVPTFVMWFFDSLGMGWIKSGFSLKVQDWEPFLSLDEFSAVMLPRFGLTLFYASVILYAGYLQVYIDFDLEQMENTNLEILENYANRLERSGHVALFFAGALWLMGMTFNASPDTNAENWDEEEELSSISSNDQETELLVRLKKNENDA